MFRKADNDYNGIINEDQFVNLLLSMNLYNRNIIEDNLNRLLNIVDPFNNKQITFSECVNLFAYEEIIDINSNMKMKALDKISIDDSILN